LLAVASGRTYWLGGSSSPNIQPSCHSAYGWNFYPKSSSTGIVYRARTPCRPMTWGFAWLRGTA
jgi:hypothetical protein